MAHKATPSEAPFNIRIAKAQKRFKRVKNPEGKDAGIGHFLLVIDITAGKETVYIPLSIASGKKPTGFVYQIEGTTVGDISTTDISCKGDGVTQITLGTILYVKIPAAKKATFRMLIEMRGVMRHAYKIVINRINYKRDLKAARYERFEDEIHSETLKFG